ncbi:MAG: hypothetical protein KIT73_18495 [Burkholderiales bacterium]|nr:hypothetical protein [Burkholderiales bacterium]
MRYLARALCSLLIGALAGCMTPQQKPAAPPDPEEPRLIREQVPCVCEAKVVRISSGIDEVMRYYTTVLQKSGGELKTELELARKEFSGTGTEAARMKLSLLYLMPGSPVRNESQAQQLLEPYLRGDLAPRSPYRGLARVLLATIDDNRRIETNLQTQAAKTREEQKRADELQRKLDALKDVERTMILKDLNTRKKPP